jgi:hypothetical protein
VAVQCGQENRERDPHGDIELAALAAPGNARAVGRGQAGEIHLAAHSYWKFASPMRTSAPAGSGAPLSSTNGEERRMTRPLRK